MAVDRAGGVWFNAYHRYHGFFAGENAGCDAVGQGPGDALTHVINIKKICFFCVIADSPLVFLLALALAAFSLPVFGLMAFLRGVSG
jgi:hypothetical protein